MRMIFVFASFLISLSLCAESGVPDGTLMADGNSAKTYELLESHGYQAEVPDKSRSHINNPFQHIQQIWDSSLNKFVFQFFIHARIDDDRGLSSVNDRQRNEIKTSGKSPLFMIGQEGDSVVMRWKFLLPKGMLTTKKFTHIHQLKGIDNDNETADVAYPLITFTCCTVSNRQELQVRWQDRFDKDKTTYLARIDLAAFLGQWLEVEERVRYGSKGYYYVIIRDMHTGKIVLEVKNKGMDMWRTNCTGMRPKWGIYRYIGESRSLENELRDEELRFADFSIKKISTVNHINEIFAPVSITGDVLHNIAGQRVPSSWKGIVIDKGRKRYNK